MRVRLYEIRVPGRDVETFRGTAKAGQRIVRQHHRDGVPATLHRAPRSIERALSTDNPRMEA